MKSEAVEFAGRKMHMPGTIIGKALEPLAKGQRRDSGAAEFAVVGSGIEVRARKRKIQEA